MFHLKHSFAYTNFCKQVIFAAFLAIAAASSIFHAPIVKSYAVAPVVYARPAIYKYSAPLIKSYGYYGGLGGYYGGLGGYYGGIRPYGLGYRTYGYGLGGLGYGYGLKSYGYGLRPYGYGKFGFYG